MNEKTNPLTIPQGRQLAQLVCLLRSEWDWPGTVTAIKHAMGSQEHDAYEICLAAIRAARDLTNAKPVIIQMPGKHWQVEHDLEVARTEIQQLRQQLRDAEDRSAGKYTPPATNDPRCDEHPGEHFSNCRECAKVKTPMPSNFRELAGIVPKQRVKAHRRLERAELEQEPTNDETKPGEGHAA